MMKFTKNKDSDFWDYLGSLGSLKIVQISEILCLLPLHIYQKKTLKKYW